MVKINDFAKAVLAATIVCCSNNEAVSAPINPSDIKAIAQTLAGECYDDKELDKRRVCEVILNRVSSKGFPNSVIGVLRKPKAFNGYWKQSRPISFNDYKVAEEALKDWYDNECMPLSDLLYFRKGCNRENVFRTKF